MTQSLNHNCRPLLALFSIAALILFAGNAGAQNYPDHPITFVVPFAPGGLSDVPGRLLAAEMQKRVGQPVVVENKPGASGIAGATYVWRASPDGYTLLVNALADVQNLHYLHVPYDPIKDFALIGMVTDGPPLVLIVNANEPYKSVAELVAYAKANPTKVSFGTSGPATSPAIAVTQLNNQAKTISSRCRTAALRQLRPALRPARCKAASPFTEMLVPSRTVVVYGRLPSRRASGCPIGPKSRLWRSLAIPVFIMQDLSVLRRPPIRLPP